MNDAAWMGCHITEMAAFLEQHSQGIGVLKMFGNISDDALLCAAA
jgi:hypothetical protein